MMFGHGHSLVTLFSSFDFTIVTVAGQQTTN